MKAETIHQRLIDLNWDHARQLGVPGHSAKSSWSYSTDPEALTVLVGIVSDERLKREWIGWLKKFGNMVYTNRLKKILDNLYESVDHKKIEPNASELKSILVIAQKQSNHSFQPVIDFLDHVEIDEEKDDRSRNDKISQIEDRKIIENEPRLFWRHVAGVNARSELLSSVDAGWTGNGQRGSSELYLPRTSLQRAVRSLEPTGMISVDPVDNSKVISKGSNYTVPYEHSRSNFIHWGNWIEAMVKLKDLIDKNKDKNLTEDLKERFTDSTRSILEEEVLRPAYTHRHGKQPSKKLIDRIV